MKTRLTKELDAIEKAKLSFGERLNEDAILRKECEIKDGERSKRKAPEKEAFMNLSKDSIAYKDLESKSSLEVIDN